MADTGEALPALPAPTPYKRRREAISAEANRFGTVSDRIAISSSIRVVVELSLSRNDISPSRYKKWRTKNPVPDSYRFLNSIRCFIKSNFENISICWLAGCYQTYRHWNIVGGLRIWFCSTNHFASTFIKPSLSSSYPSVLRVDGLWDWIENEMQKAKKTLFPTIISNFYLY